MNLYKRTIRPILFSLKAETAQDLGYWAFRRANFWQTFRNSFSVKNERLRSHVLGISVENPVGLAAGYDKNCRLIRSMASLGFGFLTVGSVMPEPRLGNPRPNLIRYEKQESLVNSLGLPSEGLEASVLRLHVHAASVPMIASVGAFTIDDFARCCYSLEAYVDGLELNVSCPNLTDGREFENLHLLDELLTKLHELKKPVSVKISPYISDRERDEKMELVSLCAKRKVTGITASNTRGVKEARVATGFGGLSGRLMLEQTLRIVRDLFQETRGQLAISACGGISSGADAFEAIRSGASTVQLLTSLVFEGPGVVKRVNTELLELLRKRGFNSIDELRGS